MFIFCSVLIQLICFYFQLVNGHNGRMVMGLENDDAEMAEREVDMKVARNDVDVKVALDIDGNVARNDVDLVAETEVDVKVVRNIFASS